MTAIIVTGGCGFIGSALIRYLINETNYTVINVDKLTYAANLNSLNEIETSSRYHFHQVDICNSHELSKIFDKYEPIAVMHLAAESHVDRSIDKATDFITTNVYGTYCLLEVARNYWLKLENKIKALFRFIHVSTDEVYGDLVTDDAPAFTELNRYAPSSPYAASKAASDHFVRAWHRTYELPIIVTNCSNNFGPWQNEEKLIPKIIKNALSGQPIPLYGDGLQVRDWLYVDDHVKALCMILEQGDIGQSYNIGGTNERRNIDVVHKICDLLDEFKPLAPDSKTGELKTYKSQIHFVTDRLGHDVRYSVDSQKLQISLNWKSEESFESGLIKTINWFLQTGLK